jgi:hypothetical protein
MYRIIWGGGLIFPLFLMHLLLIAFAVGESSTSELFFANSLLLVGASVSDESSTQEEGAECGKERPHCRRPPGPAVRCRVVPRNDARAGGGGQPDGQRRQRPLLRSRHSRSLR